jgi:hypothetical protein
LEIDVTFPRLAGVRLPSKYLILKRKTLAVGVATRERVSAQNSLVTGIFAANFSKLARIAPISAVFIVGFTGTYGRIPDVGQQRIILT